MHGLDGTLSIHKYNAIVKRFIIFYNTCSHLELSSSKKINLNIFLHQNVHLASKAKQHKAKKHKAKKIKSVYRILSPEASLIFL